MIDTDKYEGHTPANLWGREIVAEGKRKIFLNNAWLSSIGNDVYSNEKDRLLMADAPLLLAEVKRYRQVFDRAIECALNDNAEQAMQFLLNMDYCLDDEEKVTDKNRHKYTWVNGEWRDKND